jgi:hypothetical protein
MTTAEPSSRGYSLPFRMAPSSPGLDPNELVDIIVCLHAYVFAWCYRHHYQLAVRPCEKYLTDVIVLQRLLFYVGYISCHVDPPE